MTWSRRGQRVMRVAAAAFRGRRGGQSVCCVGTPRLLSTPSALPATSLPLSPAVRYLVDTNSLDPSLIPASGPHSRLLKGDVLWYMETGTAEASSPQPSPSTTTSPSPLSPSPLSPSPIPPSPSSQRTSTQVNFTDVTVGDVHRSRALTSVQSKMSLPHSSATIDCQVGPLLSSLQHSGRERGILLLESYFIKAAATTLKQLPHSNAVWNEDGLFLFPSVNISVRVSLSEGRLLPASVIIRDADRASVQSIAAAIERARAGGEDGGATTVTSSALMVTSLLSSSLSHYTDLVTFPHSAALSLAGIQKTFSEEGSGSATVAVCLSSDSRVLNSDLASQWLQQFKNNIGNF